MIQTLILDFDGIILESVSVKTEAFRKLFSFVPEHQNEIVQFHKDNGGMSRFDKIRYIYSNIIKEILTQKKFEDLSDKFATIVFKEVIKAPFVPGAQEFLEKYYRIIPMYVVSATPENELIQIIQKRDLSHYFIEVFGAPRKKKECIVEIVKFTNSPNESVMFIGDSKNDYIAAQEAGVHFIGRVKEGEKNQFTGLIDVESIISDLYELIRYLEVQL